MLLVGVMLWVIGLILFTRMRKIGVALAFVGLIILWSSE